MLDQRKRKYRKNELGKKETKLIELNEIWIESLHQDF